MPPTFILSQDQTLQFIGYIDLIAKTQASRDQLMNRLKKLGWLSSKTQTFVLHQAVPKNKQNLIDSKG